VAAMGLLRAVEGHSAGLRLRLRTQLEIALLGQHHRFSTSRMAWLMYQAAFFRSSSLAFLCGARARYRKADPMLKASSRWLATTAAWARIDARAAPVDLAASI
jgi:hypothetical protein